MDTFKIKLEELKDLKCVQGIKLKEDGIYVDFGEIEINYKNKIYYIGHITGVITPTSITFKNLNNKQDGYQHPHINSSGSACFGTYSDEIYPLLNALEFKKLIFILTPENFRSLRGANSPIPFWAKRAAI